MSIVVDASVLVVALSDSGPEGQWADQLIQSETLSAPLLVQVETTNILRRLELAGKIDSTLAIAAQRDLMSLEVELFPFEPFAARVWQLRGNVTSYDAWYVALAESLSAPLATLDLNLTRAPGPMCRFLSPT